MLQMEDGALWQLSETRHPDAHPIAWSDTGRFPMLDRAQTISLRERFLAEQQSQLREDAKLSDPAEAYRALLEELEEIGTGTNFPRPEGVAA
jgi:hypothetical protein